MVEATVADRIQNAMQASNITQSKLAELIQSSQAAVSQWCSGKKAPSEENLEAIARVLQVNKEWLQHGTGRIKVADETAERQDYRHEGIWSFRIAPADGGRDYGNANVWSFDPGLEVLVREVLQNVVDAAVPGSDVVKVMFRLIQLQGEDLVRYRDALNWEILRKHLQASVKDGQKLGALIRDGLQDLADAKEMLLLVVEDSGTTGLLGPEKGIGKFAALCRNNLDSNKEESVTKGGAFGLGKAVLWRASRFATVTFCSNLSKPTDEGESYLRVFGRCDLPWHESNAKAYAGPGWFGAKNTKISEDAVSFWQNETFAKDLYLDRGSLGSGTSIGVVGFHDASSDQPRSVRELAADLERATARYFFPALALGNLTVTIESYEGRRRYDERSPTVSTTVKVAELQPEYYQLLKAFREGTFRECIVNEGDVACCRVTLEVPKRKVAPIHDEYKHDAILLVRQVTEEQPTAPPNELAVFRGPGMVVEYRSLTGICLGACPFHAALLCGKAPEKAFDSQARDEIADSAAEEFLRTAEPPSHNKWTATPDLKAAYVRGCKTKLEEFLVQVKEAVRDLVKPATRDLGDGPFSLRELFRLGNEPIPQERPRVVEQHGEVDERDRWNVIGRVRLKARGSALRIRPVVLFVGETGGGQAVKWEVLEAVSGCSVDGKDLLVAPNTRDLRFRGVTDADSHPVPARESCIVVDLQRVAIVAGGAR